MKVFGLRPRRLTLAVSLLIPIVAGETARAAEDAEAVSSTGSTSTTDAQTGDEGVALYRAGDYRQALEKFREAYAVGRDSNLLFNMARCYEELGELSAAIEKYDAFVTAPDADEAGREKARASLSRLRARLTAQPENAEPGEALVLASPSPHPGTASAEADSGSSSLGPEVTLGAGIASGVIGGTLYYLGIQDHNDVTNASGYDDPGGVVGLTQAEARSLVDSGDAKKLAGGIALGLSGALIAVSVTWFITRGKQSRAREATLGFNVAPTRRGSVVSVSRSF